MHANDDVISERSIFNKNHEHKSFVCVAVNPSVPIIWDLIRKVTETTKYTHTHTHTQDSYRIPHCTCMRRGKYGKVNMHKNSQSYHRKEGVSKGRMQCGGEKQGRKEGGQGRRSIGWWEG